MADVAAPAGVIPAAVSIRPEVIVAARGPPGGPNRLG